MDINTDIEIAKIHAEAGLRQAALGQAIGSLAQNPTPAGTETITERAEAFFVFLSAGSNPA